MDAATSPASDPVLAGPGAARAALRAVNWHDNPLGPPARWPAALRVAVQMLLDSHFPKALFWGPRMVTIHNDAFRPILGGKPEAQGRSFYDIWAEAWQDIGPIADRAMAGEATFIEDFPLVVNRHGYAERCTFTFCYSPVRDEWGKVQGVLDTVMETTGKTRIEHDLEVRNAELAHRIKNTFAVISVVARQTLRQAPDTTAAWDVLSHRLQALSEVHRLLSYGAVSQAGLGDVVAAALAPHRDGTGRLSISGPAVPLPDSQALALALVVNELATNALKHGALRDQSGRVDICWSAERLPAAGDEAIMRIHFDWTEHCKDFVPPPSGATGKGFGTLLLTQVAPADFGGEARLSYAGDGLKYSLTGDIPLPCGKAAEVPAAP